MLTHLENGSAMPTLRRKFYKPQLDSVRELIEKGGPGHWEIMGPREKDARVLVRRQDRWSTDVWLISATGVVTTRLELGDLDAGEFGYRGGATVG